MKIRPSSRLLIGILVVSLFTGVFSLTYPSIKTKLVPAFASWLIFVLAAIELRKELRIKDEAKDTTDQNADSEQEVRSEGTMWKTLLPFGWIVGFLLGVYLVGFLITIPLFILSYLKTYAHGWLISIALAAVATGLIYAVFEVALQVRLFPGVIFY
ncbi:tripartite tricarboxylate transporter TctB family protein [Chloroflexota bacterium]